MGDPDDIFKQVEEHFGDNFDLSLCDDDNRSFSEDELKQLCTMKCTVQLYRRNIYLSYERKVSSLLKEKGIDLKENHNRYIFKKFQKKFRKHYEKYLGWENDYKNNAKLFALAKNIIASNYLDNLNSPIRLSNNNTKVDCSEEIFGPFSGNMTNDGEPNREQLSESMQLNDGKEPKLEIDEDQNEEEQDDNTPSQSHHILSSPYPSQHTAGLQQLDYLHSEEDCFSSEDFENFIHAGNDSELQVETQTQDTYSQFNRLIQTARENDCVTSTQAPYYEL